MPKDYIFRKASPRDLSAFFPEFAKSLKSQFPEYSSKTKEFFVKREYCLEALKSQLDNKEIVIYLAILASQAVGFLIARYICGGVCLCSWLAVAEGHRGKGLASQLLKMWQNEAKKAGIHKLHLWTGKRNLDFYKKKGFTYVGKIPKNYYGADDYLFYKVIQKPQEKNFLKNISL
ncbi:MAG: GNAT family N-acetyltransferase [Candidatus Pacebacteria bacterium]|nr:GNAT family N-acetyltransferase [Candidatus Paceibacterota bacterium]